MQYPQRLHLSKASDTTVEYDETKKASQPAKASDTAREGNAAEQESETREDSGTAVEDSAAGEGSDTAVEDSEEPNLDSGLENEGDEESTTTLTPSVREGTYHCGRRYQSYAPENEYPLPDDEEQQFTQDVGDYLWHLTLHFRDGLCRLEDEPVWKDTLFCAPLKNTVQNVLDLGTGTGTWAVDYADCYPAAAVIGLDLSPIQPVWTAPNCSFELDEFGSDWRFVERFDFIHSRYNCLSFRNPIHMIRSAYHALKPGGTLEIQEFTYHLRCVDDSWIGTALKDWRDLLLEGLKRLGLGYQMTEYLEIMEKRGFQNVKYESFVWPINTWTIDRALKRLGEHFNLFLTSDLEGLSMWIFTKALGWDEERVRILCARVKKDLKNPRIHVVADVGVIYGSKPNR